MLTKEDVQKINEKFKDSTAQQLLAWFAQQYSPGRIALASSLGAEDQVLTDMLMTNTPDMRIFTLDTGRLPEETYDVMERTRGRYGLTYTMLFPEHRDIESITAEQGPNLFYRSVDSRKLCCQIRKVKPLRRMLSHLDVWICGLRRDQAVTRADVLRVEWDETFGLIKLNPLADWSEQQVWDYIRTNNVPYNLLHDKGYPTIGCSPCTRAVADLLLRPIGKWI